jgi:hypothetical protein
MNMNDDKDRDITNPTHPYHKLYLQSYSWASHEDHKRGREPDEKTRNLAGSLTVLAAESGFKDIDHISFSLKTNHLKAGENVFVVQGEPPSHLRAHMPTTEAINKDFSTSLMQLDDIQRKQQQVLAQLPQKEQSQAQQQIENTNLPTQHELKPRGM